MIAQETANQMLKNIPDPNLRAVYGNILAGKYVYKVYCLRPQTNPKTKKPYHAEKCLIGFIAPNSQVLDSLTTNKKGEPIAGIETSRDRLDGRKGFKCYCGNYSIQSAEERGVLKTSRAPLPPTKEELQEIFSRVQASGKGPLQFVNGCAEYDGFMLQEVTT